MRRWLCIILPTLLLSQPVWSYDIYDVSTQREITIDQLSQNVGQVGQIIALGETHYTQNIQNAQADIIAKTSQATPVIAWEFLELEDAEQVETLANLRRTGEINSIELLDTLFSHSLYHAYAPLIDLVASHGAELASTNLSREQKRPVSRGGISALDPALLPPDFAMGSDAYFERFEEAMGEHTHGLKIENLFASQCLTDDVIAHAIEELETEQPIFLVAGHFHTDFFSGAVERLMLRLPKTQIVSIRFMSKSELEGRSPVAAAIDHRYGAVADYLIVVD